MNQEDQLPEVPPQQVDANPDSQPIPAPEPPTQPKGSSKKKKIIITVVILVVILAAVGGWFIWQSKHKDTPTPKSETSQQKEPNQAPETLQYKNDSLGLSLTYPLAWGEATLVKGPLVSPQSGNYQQLVFADAPKVNINFVEGPYGSPLDACGLEDPAKTAQHAQFGEQASVIGWENTDIKKYGQGQGFTEPTVYAVSKDPGENGIGWIEVSKNGKVLEYKSVNDERTRYKASTAEDACVVTQAQADEANKYLEFFHYAANYSNPKVYGVNGQFDARTGDDPTTRSQLIDVLNSITAS